MDDHGARVRAVQLLRQIDAVSVQIERQDRPVLRLFQLREVMSLEMKIEGLGRSGVDRVGAGMGEGRDVGLLHRVFGLRVMASDRARRSEDPPIVATRSLEVQPFP